MTAIWAAVEPNTPEQDITAITNADTALAQVYTDVTAHLANMDFIYQNGRQPEAEMAPHGAPPPVYNINYGQRAELGAPYNDVTRYVGAMLHEMMHITAALQYNTNAPAGTVGHVANMHLPAANGPIAPADAEFGLADNQFTDPHMGAIAQLNTMVSNWDTLGAEADLDLENDGLTQAQFDVVRQRIDYAKAHLRTMTLCSPISSITCAQKARQRPVLTITPIAC